MAGRSRTPLLLALLTGALLAGESAWADIFAFTDERGVVHYTNVPNDTRYKVVMVTPVALMGPAGEPSPRIRLDILLHRIEPYAQMIERAAEASSLEPALVRAVLVAESGGDPKALSRRGAQGLMQLMPATARQYGVRNVFDPEENIRAGSRYLRDLAARYGNDLQLVLAAYNAGPAAVDSHGGKVPPWKETLDYVPRVLGIYQHLHDTTRDP
jgi:soluble lytic murein transglycosylase-like protein